MDWTAIIQELGGGIGAVALVGLGYLYWSERQENRRLNNARIEDSKSVHDVLTGVRVTQEKMVNAVASLTDEIRRGSGQ